MIINPVKDIYSTDISEFNQKNINSLPNTEKTSNDKKNTKTFEDSVDISDEGKKAYEELNEEEKKQVEKLKQTDREVKAHEQAHLAASGGIAVSGAQFTYKTGPDGEKYAVGGEVNIDTSKEKDPEDTIKKAEQIRRAAMAPANPSSTDLKVAAEAATMLQQARAELSKQNNSYKKNEDFYNSSESGSIDMTA